MRPDFIGELGQNAIDLFDFFDLQFPDAIARLDCRRRLDEERAASRRGVVDDSTNGTLRLATDWNDVAAIPDGDRHVGDTLVRLEFGHRALEKLDQLAL